MGAPNMAPTPTSSPTCTLSALTLNTATTGTMASGKAVPTAAKIEPVTPSDIFRR